jgi:hypothetical protein
VKGKECDKSTIITKRIGKEMSWMNFESNEVDGQIC